MKYIVYCTTNLINNKIYIGQHLVKDPNEFDGYLGCGCYIQHVSSYKNPKTSFQKAVKKYGPKNFRRKIIEVFDNLEDALKLEAQLVNIDFLKRNDVYNEILGGNSGDTTVSVKCYQYDLNGNFIAEYRSKQQASYAVCISFSTIKSAIKNKVKSANSFWSTEKVKKLDLTKFKTGNNKKKVYQYNLNGVYEREYSSVSEAAKILGSTSTNVSRSCKTNIKCKNKLLSYKLNDIYIPIEIDIEYKNIKTTQGKPRQVAQYDKFGKLIKIYSTVTECKKHFSGCKHVLSGKYKTSGGYIFKYIN